MIQLNDKHFSKKVISLGRLNDIRNRCLSALKSIEKNPSEVYVKIPFWGEIFIEDQTKDFGFELLTNYKNKVETLINNILQPELPFDK